MSDNIAAGALLVLLGIWLLLQTLVGDLPGRILSWRNTGAKSTTPEGVYPEDPSGGKGVNPWVLA